MKPLFYLTSILLSTLMLFSCQEEEITPGEITYPEFYDGRLNLLSCNDGDTVYVSISGLEFTLASNIPAQRSLKVVVKPAYGTYWSALGFNYQSNLDWESHSSNTQVEFNTDDEDFEKDKFCKINGTYVPLESTDPNQVIVPLHVIVYEDKNEWITKYVILQNI